MENLIIKIKNLFKQDLKTQNSFVIVEIGHNNKGSLKIAKELFYSAKKSGASAIKLVSEHPGKMWVEKNNFIKLQKILKKTFFKA